MGALILKRGRPGKVEFIFRFHREICLQLLGALDVCSSCALETLKALDTVPWDRDASREVLSQVSERVLLVAMSCPAAPLPHKSSQPRACRSQIISIIAIWTNLAIDDVQDRVPLLALDSILAMVHAATDPQLATDIAEKVRNVIHTTLGYGSNCTSVLC